MQVRESARTINKEIEMVQQSGHVIVWRDSYPEYEKRMERMAAQARYYLTHDCAGLELQERLESTPRVLPALHPSAIPMMQMQRG